MNEIVLQEKQLPDTIPDLAKFALVGREKLVAVRAEIRAIDKVGLAKEVLSQKRAEAQELAELVTLSEMRIGAMLKEIPKATNNNPTGKNQHGGQKCSTAHLTSTAKSKSEVLKEAGIPQDTAKRFQKMAEHEDIVMQAIEEARENDDIVSRSSVLKKIDDKAKAKKKEAREKAIREQVEKIEQGGVEKPDGKFDVIAIDPPWNYGTSFDPNGRRVANPYPEMSLEELKALEIPAADDCVMFLWTTQKFIWDAKELLDTWGFTYRAMFVWDKDKIGMGDLIRMQCEFCLIGIKGKPVFKDEHGIRDIIREPRREHSRKPEVFYKIVNDLCVGRKLDFFSREKREGWCSYGNDTEKFSLGK